MTCSVASLPLVLSGPIVRHIATDTLTIWMTTKASIKHRDDLRTLHVSLFTEDKQAIQLLPSAIDIIEYQIGEHCFVSTIIVSQDKLFENQKIYFYDIEIAQNNAGPIKLSESLSELLYPKESLFSFKFSQTLTKVLHGSCRKAHFDGIDALPQLDNQISESIAAEDASQRPDLMLFTGDQVYIDDVAGPMLHAIHQVVRLLGLFHERFEGSTIIHSEELFDHKDSLYRRDKLLPKTDANEDLTKAFFKAKQKPIFTSVNANNHLISLSEMNALYLLSWSSRLWPTITLHEEVAEQDNQERYANEQRAINNFINGLPQVERSLAHIPVYMIFDDHDVTDDWNLTRAWEEQIYNNPFSNRIVGNALVAYLLFQGMGNPRATWDNLREPASTFFSSNGFVHHDEFIEALLNHDRWQYKLDTHPPVQVLDTRTQRWRSESNKNKPSGLMDWEGLCDLQQDIIGKQSVIMVSAAPVYGVKFIEAIQRLFITFGGALIVDAENWMAHRGTASVMLNIFRHIKTPPNFIILSGDVHYSFVYDISLRFRRNSPKIIQFTCSGIHNQFPDKLIKWFERLNRWLYGHRSPLNWLTKRRNMSIREREAHFHSEEQANKNLGESKDIVNGTALGLLELGNDGNEKACRLILADGSLVSFKRDN
jgi:hypothetical protein